jgi:hypothetical protein
MHAASTTDEHAPEPALPVDPARPLLLDFDETYWLRNSTEAFLDSVRPAWPAAILLRVLDGLRPWQLLPGPDKAHVWRDWLRVMLVVVLFPWSLPRWRRQATALGPRWLNPVLAGHVARAPADRRWIVTNGFRPIVAPLVAALEPGHRPMLLASPLLTGFAWRRLGKRAVAEAALGAETVAEAALVTDNDEDGPLLAAVGLPLHRKWPEARFEPAHRNAYLPFYYMERIKRPGGRHLQDVVVKDELVLLLICYLWASASLPALLAIVVLHLSFWVIYEIVYVENDRVGERFEADPTLSAAFHDEPHRFSEPLAWLTGLAVGLLGVALLQLVPAPGGPGVVLGFGPVLGFGLWAAFLAALRATAWLYNHVDKQTRVPLYLALQAFKLLGLALFLPLPLAAAMLLAAHLAAVWLPYVAYRQRGAGTATWRAPNQLYRLALGLALALLLVASQGPGGLGAAGLAQLGLGLAFFALKARHDLARLGREARWLGRP